MKETSDTYAPQSPDLSSFLSGDDSHHQQQTKVKPEPYRPRSPEIPSLQYRQTEYEQYPPIPPLPQVHHQFGSGYQAPIQSPTYPTSQYNQFPPSQSYTQSPPIYHQPLPVTANKQTFPNNSVRQQPTTNITYPSSDNNHRNNMAQQATSSSGGAAGNGLGPSQGIEIKTKFPVARIKRIMQADEEVGKVAQVTPVAVSKALELFMITLCTRSADVARSHSSKRITAAHLKHAIEADRTFDFLWDITAKVPGAPQDGEAGEKKGRGKAKNVEQAQQVKGEEDSEGDVKPKVKSTRGRKKKVESD